MIVKFGNLVQPRHSEDPEKPEAKAKIEEMMQKLHEAGFVRQENIANGVKEGKFYHVFDMPHQIEFGGGNQEALEIMKPYSNYMKPIQLVGPTEMT
jgi:hypothetical protein